jgi:hypothetical protein
LRLVEIGLIALIVGLICYAGYMFVLPDDLPPLLPEDTKGIAVSSYAVNAVWEPPKPLSEYVARMEESNLFGDPEAVPSVEAPVTQAAPVSEDSAFTADHRIVGIVIGDPSEVIIENARSQQTMFLEEGQTQGDISIEKIVGNTVRLKYKGVLLESALTE